MFGSGSRSGNGGIEIKIRTSIENTLGRLKEVQKSLFDVNSTAGMASKAAKEKISEIGASATATAGQIGTLAKSIYGITSGATVASLTATAGAIGSIAGAINQVYQVSQIPIVTQQFEALGKMGEEALGEIVPLSELLKGIGETATDLGDNFLRKGFFSQLDRELKPAQAKIDRLMNTRPGRALREAFAPLNDEIGKLEKRTTALFSKASARIFGETRIEQPPEVPPTPAPVQDNRRVSKVVALRAAQAALRTIEGIAIPLRDGIRTIVNTSIGDLEKIVTGRFAEAIQFAVDRIPAQVKAKFQEVGSAISSGITPLKEGAQNLVTQFQGVFSTANSRLRGIVRALGEKIPDDIRSRFALIQKALISEADRLNKIVSRASSGIRDQVRRAGAFYRETSIRVIAERAGGAASTFLSSPRLAREQVERARDLFAAGSQSASRFVQRTNDRFNITGRITSTRDALADSVESATNSFRSLTPKIRSSIDSARSAIDGIGDRIPTSIRERVGQAVREISDRSQGVADIGAGVRDRISKSLKGLISSLPEEIRVGIDRLRKKLIETSEQVASSIKDAWRRLPETLGDLRDSVPRQIQDRFEVVRGKMLEGLRGISGVIKSAGGELLKLVRSLAGDLPAEMKERLTSLRDGAINAAKDFREKIKSADTSPIQRDGLTTPQPLPPPPAPVRTPGLVDSIVSQDQRQRLVGLANQGFAKAQNVYGTFERSPENLQKFTDRLSSPALALSGVNKPVEIFNGLKESVGAASEKIAEASQQVFFFTSAFDSLKSIVANGPYQALIGQNVELRQQLLETQSSIVATNKVLRDGQQITDPTAAIQALDAPVKAAIAKIRRDSLELVGVTSKDLVGVFNVINQSASQANISLAQSADLTSSFAAALGTIGLPLNQARQEINSILTAQIDQNSTLAKTLSLDNERIRQLTQQGKLYDYLTDKLKAFRAGNALAAKTIEGVGSNIQEIFDNITMEAGSQLIEPIVEQLTRFYEALSSNKDFLTDYTTGLVTSIKNIALSISTVVEVVSTKFAGIALQIPQYLFKTLENGAKQFAEAITFVLEVFTPLIELIGKAMTFIGPGLLSPLFKVGITLKIVGGLFSFLHGAIKTTASMLPGLSTAMMLVTGSTQSAVLQFFNLKKELGSARLAIGLLAGKELANIPELMAGVTKGLTQAMGQFGFLAPAIAPLIPQLSGVAISLIGLNKQFPIIGKVAGEAAEVFSGKVLPAMASLARQSGLPELGGQIDTFANKAKGLANGTELLSEYNKRFTESIQQAGRAMATKVVKITAWTAALGLAVVVLMEFWKRSEDAGDQVVKLAKNITQTAELIRSTWDETRASTNKPLIDENAIPATDWIDSIILKMREFEKSPIEALKKANNFKDGLILLGQVIVQVFSVAYKTLETAIRLVSGVATLFTSAVSTAVEVIVAGWDVIQTIFKNPLDFGAIQGAFDGFGKIMSNSFGKLASTTMALAGDVVEPWTKGFRDLETKGEESFRELGNALDEGGLGKSVEEVTAALDGLEKEIENAAGGAGALFSEELAPVTAAIANLKNGTGSIKDVKDAIASVSQQFPNLAKDLEGVSAQLSTEFPGDALAASKSIDQLAEGIVKLNNDGKPGLEGIAMAIDKFRAGKGSISEVKGEIEKYKATLTSLDDKKQIESLAAPIDALERSIASLDGNASNKKIADFSAALSKNIEEAQALLKEAEKGGAGSAEASAAREKLAALEAERDRLDKLTESVKVMADPYLKLQNQLGAAKESIEKTTTDISNAQKEATARIRTAAASGVDIDTGEKKLITDSEARILTLQQETQSIREEIPARYEAVKKLREIYDAMTPEEKERSKDLKRQLDSEQAALYEATANGAEKRAELEKAIADKAISDIDRANKLALEKVEAAETERLVLLSQMRAKGLITAEDFEAQKADAGVESAKKELAAQEEVLKKLEKLPKPNDPDEAREREDRIRAEKLKSSQLTLKLIDAENAAYEAQTRKILALIEAANDRRKAALEAASRSGKITDAQKAEQEAALEIRKIRQELAREKDANRRAELRLELEKAKTAKAEAKRRREQEQFEMKQAAAEAEQLKAQREGTADAGASYEATLNRRLEAARRAVLIAKDENEKIKANLELQKVLNDIEADRIDRNLKVIENSYKRQNNSIKRQIDLMQLAETSLSKQKELIDAGNQLRQAVGEYYDQTLGTINSLEKSDYRRRQLAEVTATIKLKAAIEEAKIAEQTLAIEQQMKRLALEREKIQARMNENEKLGNIKRLEAEEKKARLKGASPEEIEAIQIEKQAAIDDLALARENTSLIEQQAAAQEQIFESQRRVLEIQNKGKVESAAGNLIQNMADPVNRYNAGEQYKEYLARQLGADNYTQLREGGLQGARSFQEQFFGQQMSRQGLQRGQFFDIDKAISDRQSQAFSQTLPGSADRLILGGLSSPLIAPQLAQPQLSALDSIAASLSSLRDSLPSSGKEKAGVTVTISALNVTGNVAADGKTDPAFSTNFRREIEKVFNEASRLALAP